MAAPHESEVKAGWDYYRRGDVAGAERCCRKVLALDPAHGGAQGLLGLLRLTLGHADEAAALLSQALKSKPRDAMLLGGLGLARLMRGEAAGAEEALRSALKWGNRDDAMLHMRLGMALGAQGKSADAVKELQRALQLAPDSPEVLLNLANALAESGVVKEAESLLKRLLARLPAHGDARYNLGTLYTRQNRLDEAAVEFRALLQQYPDSADAHNSLGIVLERRKELDAAAEAYRKALALEANHVPALNNLGNVLRTQGRLDEAEPCYAKAMQLAPAHADGYLNMGLLRAREGRPASASELFEKALTVDPQCLEAATNLGELYLQSGMLQNAAEAFRNALGIDANSINALNGLGDLLRMQGRFSEAAELFSRAMHAMPTDVNGFINLGILRVQQGRCEEACTLLRQAIQVDGRSAAAHLKLAEALKVSGRLEESKAAYEQLLTLRPGNVAAMAGLAHVRQHLCDWDGIEALWDATRRALRAGEDAGITPFSALSIPTTPDEQRNCARAWAHRELGWIGEGERLQVRGTSTPKSASDRLKVGYLSWDYHEHATAYLMAEVFELHDRTRFDVTAYSIGPDDGSAIRHRIQHACDSFVDIATLSDIDAARRIADDGIDILIDLKGYTLGARTPILAYRPALVQVNWLGFPGTMGAKCIDWILADTFIIPDGAESNFDERIYRLPDCYQPNDRRRPVAEAPTRAECGLPESGVIFCCFNQPYKIVPEMFAAWMRILGKVPGSVLWLLETNAWAMRNLRSHAASHGVSAERLVFAPHCPLATHLARYRIADLALDTFPYTSHTTASDALWAGCPLVALVGDTFASRVSGSVLRAANMAELATHTLAEFERLAIELALSPARRADLRSRLEQNRMTVPLFDAPRFVANLEHALFAMRRELLGIPDGRAA